MHGYPILVIKRRAGFELRVNELLLMVRAPTLQQGYDLLSQRLHEIIDRARDMEALDELPPPAAPPLRPLARVRSLRS